jgi:YbbR domain-containing protein
MAQTWIGRALVDDLPLKLVSLVIAVTLFVVVRSDKDAATGAYVKVVYELPADRVLVSDPVGEVRVGVRGPWTRLQHFDEREVEPIRVDLRNYHEGELHFEESMVKLPVGLRVSSMFPSEMKVEFDERVVKELPVQPLVEGEPATGYRVTRLQATPARVRVDGAKRAIALLERVPTRPLRIVGARAPVKGEVGLEVAPRHTRLLDVSTATVEATIEPEIVERSFDPVPVRVLGLTRLDALIEPATVRLTLRGPHALVSAVAATTLSVQVDAQLIDLRPPTKYIRSLAVAGVPAGVAAELQPDSVSITTRRRRE